MNVELVRVLKKISARIINALSAIRFFFKISNCYLT
jgi:hypothetical protein